MTEKLLQNIVDELGSIYTNIPSETNLFEVEDKLDRLIRLMETQTEISQRISEQLENIDDNIPTESRVKTDLIESRLERISDKLDDMNNNLEYIQSNTSNL